MVRQAQPGHSAARRCCSSTSSTTWSSRAPSRWCSWPSRWRTGCEALKHRARAAGLPTIYINDNFGKWRSDFRSLVEHCVNDEVPGREVARLLKPDDEDYFVLKPKQSAFFGTTLDTLLRSLGTTTVILTGIAGDNCVLFSANDAYLRDLKLFIPSDCVVSNTEEENRYALKLMQKVVKADIRPSTGLDLEALP